MLKLDVYDKRLLNELDRYSNISLVRLSKKLKRSKQFILYRMRRMEQEGLILSYNAIIDTEKLGYLTYRFYIKMHNFNKKDKEDFEKDITNFKDEILNGQDEILEKLSTLLQEKIIGEHQEKKQKKILAIHNKALKEHNILSSKELHEITKLEFF